MEFACYSPKTWTAWILLAILNAGCDDRVTQVSREAADRQAQQNTAMAELNKEVAGGTHGLVAADAQARKEMVEVHHELQAERGRLDSAWSEVERERQQLAGQRRTESLLIPVLQAGGIVAVVIILLGFSWRAVVALRGSDNTEAHLNELLIRELVPENPTPLSDGLRWPALPDDSHAPDLLR